MVDAYGMWDLDTTLRIAEAIAPSNITFLEEPLPYTDPDQLALVGTVSSPLA